jgi:DNA-binding SARP family transcriptional activator
MTDTYCLYENNNREDGMLRSDGKESVTQTLSFARRNGDTRVSRASSDDAPSSKRKNSKPGNGNRESADGDSAMVGLVQNAYLRLLAGDSLNARLTLERALASQGVGALAGEALNTAQLINGRAKPRDVAGSSARPYQSPGDPGAARVVIRTLGKFEVIVDGVSPGSKRKPPYRPLGMLKVLIANGGCAVSEGVIIDALWPDLDGDHAHDARQVALHRLRKLLGSADAISVSHGRMFIDAEQVWVDALTLESLCRNPFCGSSLERAEIALDLYHGVFLPQEIDAQWTVRMRECLRVKFVNIVAKAAMELERSRNFSEAASLFERGLAVDDLDNVLRTGLVRCLKKTGPAGVNQTKP